MAPIGFFVGFAAIALTALLSNTFGTLSSFHNTAEQLNNYDTTAMAAATRVASKSSNFIRDIRAQVASSLSKANYECVQTRTEHYSYFAGFNRSMSCHGSGRRRRCYVRRTPIYRTGTRRVCAKYDWVVRNQGEINAMNNIINSFVNDIQGFSNSHNTVRQTIDFGLNQGASRRYVPEKSTFNLVSSRFVKPKAYSFSSSALTTKELASTMITDKDASIVNPYSLRNAYLHGFRPAISFEMLKAMVGVGSANFIRQISDKFNISISDSGISFNNLPTGILMDLQTNIETAGQDHIKEYKDKQKSKLKKIATAQLSVAGKQVTPPECFTNPSACQPGPECKTCPGSGKQYCLDEVGPHYFDNPFADENAPCYCDQPRPCGVCGTECPKTCPEDLSKCPVCPDGHTVIDGITVKDSGECPVTCPDGRVVTNLAQCGGGGNPQYCPDGVTVIDGVDIQSEDDCPEEPRTCNFDLGFNQIPSTAFGTFNDSDEAISESNPLIVVNVRNGDDGKNGFISSYPTGELDSCGTPDLAVEIGRKFDGIDAGECETSGNPSSPQFVDLNQSESLADGSSDANAAGTPKVGIDIYPRSWKKIGKVDLSRNPAQQVSNPNGNGELGFLYRGDSADGFRKPEHIFIPDGAIVSAQARPYNEDIGNSGLGDTLYDDRNRRLNFDLIEVFHPKTGHLLTRFRTPHNSIALAKWRLVDFHRFNPDNPNRDIGTCGSGRVHSAFTLSELFENGNNSENLLAYANMRAEQARHRTAKDLLGSNFGRVILSGMTDEQIDGMPIDDENDFEAEVADLLNLDQNPYASFRDKMAECLSNDRDFELRNTAAKLAARRKARNDFGRNSRQYNQARTAHRQAKRDLMKAHRRMERYISNKGMPKNGICGGKIVAVPVTSLPDVPGPDGSGGFLPPKPITNAPVFISNSPVGPSKFAAPRPGIMFSVR